MDRSAAALRYPKNVTQIYGETEQPEVSQDAQHRRGRHSLVEPPFVGRTREFRQLMQLLGAARRGYGQVVMISGPAGIGKTRLAEEVALRARRRGSVSLSVGAGAMVKPRPCGHGTWCSATWTPPRICSQPTWQIPHMDGSRASWRYSIIYAMSLP